MLFLLFPSINIRALMIFLAHPVRIDLITNTTAEYHDIKDSKRGLWNQLGLHLRAYGYAALVQAG
jgi:hypothetical protein